MRGSWARQRELARWRLRGGRLVYKHARAPSGIMAGLLILVICSTCSGPLVIETPPSASTTVYRGLNLYGAFQNGFSDQTWAFPSPAELDYYKSKGFMSFRVPLLWENLQPSLFGPFDPTYLAAMDRFVAECKARRQVVSFTFINQGIYPARDGHAIGSPEVPATAFYDLWTKMALHYRNVPTVWSYDLINEPFADAQWETHAQGTIDAIRQVDPLKPIIVMPRQESALGWSRLFPGYYDPANALIYEAHVYFDHNSHGQYRGTYDQEGAYPDVGVDRIAPFVYWCKVHTTRCIVGEYGIPREPTGGATTYDTRWLTVLDNFLAYLDRSDIGGDYWSAGPYGDVNSVEPVNGEDSPQMAVLERHLGSTP